LTEITVNRERPARDITPSQKIPLVPPACPCLASTARMQVIDVFLALIIPGTMVLALMINVAVLIGWLANRL